MRISDSYEWFRCGNYENFLMMNKETWFDFWKEFANAVNFPRIDLAITTIQRLICLSQVDSNLKNEG